MKKKRIIYVFVLVAALVLSGCGSTQKDSGVGDYSYGLNSPNLSMSETQSVVSDDMEIQAEEASDAGEKATDGLQIATDGQKIIKTYDFSYDTEKFDDSYEFLRNSVAEYNGYIASSDMYGSGQRRLYLTAKIPAEHSEEFVNQLGSLGTIVSRSESAEDITMQYTDTESHITALKTEQTRINELVKEAKDIDTIIQLEDRLTDIRYELEDYQSQKNMYDNLITYCTVNVQLSEVTYTVQKDDSSVFARIKTGLAASFRDVGYTLTNFFVWFVSALPYFVVWGLILYAVYRLIRWRVRKIKQKRQAKKEAKMSSQVIKQTKES